LYTAGPCFTFNYNIEDSVNGIDYVNPHLHNMKVTFRWTKIKPANAMKYEFVVSL